MAKLIRAGAWRRLERPYTRKSKYRKKAFVRAVPANKIVKYEMGNLSAPFPYVVRLHSSVDVQVRHNALESARKSVNRLLEMKLSRKGYKFKFRVYPHHILRNNPLASGAGADRMSTGMKMSFGKAVGIAARVHKDQPIMEVYCLGKDLALAKKALTRARHKFPSGGYLEVEKVAGVDAEAAAKAIKEASALASKQKAAEDAAAEDAEDEAGEAKEGEEAKSEGEAAEVPKAEA